MAQTREGAIKVAAMKCGLTVEEYTSYIEAGRKRCTLCKTWKPTESFGNDSSRHDGKSTKCFDCIRVKEPKTTKGRVSTFKGRSHTEEAKAAMSTAKQGQPSKRTGIPRSEAERKKISQSLRASSKVKRGVDSPSYRHGQYERNLDARRSLEYRDWRLAVFTRDKFTCQHCGDSKGGNLQAHHIKGFAEHVESRFDSDNGITLCRDCHEKVHLKPISGRKSKCRRKKHPTF